MQTHRARSHTRQQRRPLLWSALLALGLWPMLFAGTCSNDNEGGDLTTDLKGGDSIVAGSIGGFSHDIHLKLDMKCDKCHAVDDNKDVTRPGENAHSPCDTCHEDKFYEEPGEFCKVCHSEINPLVEGATKVFPYPRPGRVSAAQLISTFNHKKHLARGRDCNDCHTVTKDKDQPFATLPRHANCAKCHASGATSPSMDKCAGCHGTASVPAPKRFLTNDIRFTHGKHFVDNEGEISCATCHEKILDSTSAEDRGLPDMELCAKCHENAKKTGPAFRIKNCQVCHRDDNVGKGAIPDSHKKYTMNEVDEADKTASFDDLTRGARAVVADISGIIPAERQLNKSVKRPDNHNALFRTRHAEAASLSDAKCGFCHTSTSGSPRDNCADCHSTWRPRDHTLRWRGVEHGRSAARDSQRCSTCHMNEFCTECHNIPPPNHSPLLVFKFQHANVARFNARACLTCHTFESTCSECHILDVIPFGVIND